MKIDKKHLIKISFDTMLRLIDCNYFYELLMIMIQTSLLSK